MKRYVGTRAIHVCAWSMLLASSALGIEQWEWMGLSDPAVRSIGVAPGDSNLIAVGGVNLHVSTDGGQTWATKSSLLDVWCIAFGSSKNVAFSGTWGGGIYKSTDGCDTWAQSNTGLSNTVIKAICAEPGDDLHFYAGAEDGLYESTDGGDHWSRLKSDVNASAVVVSPLNPQTVYLGTWGSGVWKSTDAGETWAAIGTSSLPEGGECYGVALDPVDDSIIYSVFPGGGVWISFNAGVDWAQITPGFEGFAVAPDPYRPGFVYGLGGWTTPQRSGCYGGGDGWTDMSAGWSGSWFARCISVDPNDSSRVYACAGNAGLVRWVADMEPPDAPGTLSVSEAGSGVALSWEPSGSPDCAGYWIYRRAGDDAYPLAPTFLVNGRENASLTDTNVVAGVSYYYRVGAIDVAQNRSGLSNEAGAQVAASHDLDVAYITRLPRDCYSYQLEYPDGIPTLLTGTEADKRWPAFGEVVTFEAHFVNKGTATTPPANYRWKVNGQVMSTGTVPGVDPGQEGTASLDWEWNVDGLDTDHTDQTLIFELDYDDQIAETFEQNNALSDFLEGIALWIYVDEPIYVAFNGRANLVGTRSFEDWIQAQFKAMNDNFARSTYPLAPQGCLERVRIDRIVVGPMPGGTHGTADGRWQFSGDTGYAAYADRVDGGLIHELMHQLGVIDLYQMPVSAPHNNVITPDGLPVGMAFGFGRMGIMAGGDIDPHPPGSGQYMPEYCSSHDVLGLNSNVGYRRGYYGEYMFDIPANNYIVVKDSAGNPAAGVTINVYQGGFGSMDATAVSTGTTNEQGSFLLPNRPPVRTVTTATGHTERANPFGTINVVGGNATLLIEMSRPGGDFDYRFMNLTDFNLAFWGGQTENWTHTIHSRLAANSLPRITGLNAAIESSSVALVWPAAAGATGYRIYRASSYLNQPDDPEHQYENWVLKPLATVATTGYTDTTRFETCRYAVAPLAGDGTEGPLSNRVFAPNLLNPWGIAVLPDDQRVVLDPQNGFAFLRQASDGVYIANTGSEHNHVEGSRFVAIDNRLNRMLISHPSDWYGGPHSIRVTNVNGDLDGLLDFGTQGSGPGQFDNPGGVAVDDASRIYAVDMGNHRIQILKPDGSFIVAFGSGGSGEGQFEDPQGIAVGFHHEIYVCDKGNHRVQVLRFRETEQTVEYVGLLTGKALSDPTGVAVAPNGDVFVSDSAANSVEHYNAAGTWVESYLAAQAPYSGPLSNPTGVALDGLGQVIVCDTGNRRVVTVASGQGFLQADFDHDRDVDAQDLDAFEACASGPAIGLGPGCEPKDFDGDLDVDQSDFAVFQRCDSGENVPADPNCSQ